MTVGTQGCRNGLRAGIPERLRRMAWAVCAAVVCAACGDADGFDIRDYGAVGDGQTLNTEAIQRAVDACHAAGGGRVLFP